MKLLMLQLKSKYPVFLLGLYTYRLSGMYSKFTLRSWLIFAFLVNWCILFSQGNILHYQGKILENKMNGDSIYIFSSTIPEDYYHDPMIICPIENRSFDFNLEMTYPLMYRIKYLSEYNYRIYRPSFYFLDTSSNSILIDSIEHAPNYYNQTQYEYQHQFIPFLLDANKINQKSDVHSFIAKDLVRFENRLNEYVKINPTSYVALWLLIYDLSENGHSPMIDTIASNFSTRIKTEKLWIQLQNDIAKRKIKIGQKFPTLILKDSFLNERNLEIPDSKFTLINYWFSRCKPCIEKIPQLMKLDSLYSAKSLNLINISVDSEKYLYLWKKRINDYKLNWDQYLDLNGVQASKESINYFPTNFLLDHQGKIIRKNIALEELERILEQISESDK